jgi:predicted 2-oxoglutarate/Fe(II)-dependent dioxygenase YbiX
MIEELSRDAFVVEGFLDPARCAEMVARVEEVGFERALFGGVHGTRVEAVRDNDRVVEDAPGLAGELFARLEPLLPDAWRARQMLRRHAIGSHTLVGMNERLRWYRYAGEQRFRPHVDKPFVGSDGRVSCHTILVYLSGEVEGGATRLELSRGDSRKIAPEAGRLLCFDHALVHEGMPVERGVKYVLRTDLMWRKGS